MIRTLKQIDTETELGKMLLASMAIITTTSRTNKTPTEVLKEIYELRKRMFNKKAINGCDTRSTKIKTQRKQTKTGDKQRTKWTSNKHNKCKNRVFNKGR